MFLPYQKSNGFSLVELSIVLVILGLLTGGILAGQSLIRAAELRSVSTEYQRYYTASQAFRDKYFAIPGDFRDATRFWQRQTATADCISNSTATTNASGSCDGDGDGQVEYAPAVSNSGELFQFWRQLALAGLIEGSYTGLTTSVSVQEAIPGTNVPRSKISNTGWSISYFGAWVGDAQNFAADYGNRLDFGKAFAGGTTIGGGLKAEEAWNIDTKVDDGKPATGKAIVYNRHLCTNSTSATDRASTYLFTYTGDLCGFYFPQTF